MSKSDGMPVFSVCLSVSKDQDGCYTEIWVASCLLMTVNTELTELRTSRLKWSPALVVIAIDDVQMVSEFWRNYRC